MKDYMLQAKMPDYAISRQDILELIRETDSSFREGQLKRLLSYMIETSKIGHIGRNKYRKIVETVNTTRYENHYSENAQIIISIMQKEFPLD